MAEVLLARDETDAEKDGQDGPLVVVKRLLPDLALDHDLVALFERETEISRALVHPNIVRILDVGSAGGVPFLVMEHLDGLDLRGVILALRGKGARMPIDTACVIGAGVAHGLHHAHEKGIVHRDVTPHNVFLTKTGEVKVVDFGIARGKEHVALTRTGFTRGKRAYMAPEQQSGLAVDARTDVFALGVVLWEMLTSRRLFKRDTDEAIAQAVHHEPAPPPSKYAPDLPRTLEPLVMAMLSKVSAARPNARDVATHLDRLRAGAHASELVAKLVDDCS
jgi:eukaryotic-like serine/threonine-protein kinase